MKKFLLIGVLLVTAISLIPVQTDAALVPCGATQDDPATEYIVESDTCTLCHFFQLIDNIIDRFLVLIIPAVAGLLFAIGGLYLLFGAGNPSFYDKGKKTLYSVVIGLVIVYSAWVFVNTFLTFLGVVEWTGLRGWWEIPCGI